MKWLRTFFFLSSLAFSCSTFGSNAENENCGKVRFADVGWTDITVTTAVTSTLLEALGYETKTNLISVPVTFKSLENGDIDVFLGNWMPTMENDIKPYRDAGTVETVRANLEGAKYTLAVSDAAYQAGVKSFADLNKFADKFKHKIYGIEPGNDGNRLIQNMMDTNQFGLKDFTLVESSEAGMLSEVSRAIRRKRWIAFLGWEPHPMNTRFKMHYLSGGDEVFGPNFGGATIFTITRNGYQQSCPNVGQLLNNLEFSLEMENSLMDSVLNQGKKPSEAAKEWLKKHPEALTAWLKNVSDRNGHDGLATVQAHLGQ